MSVSEAEFTELFQTHGGNAAKMAATLGVSYWEVVRRVKRLGLRERVQPVGASPPCESPELPEPDGRKHIAIPDCQVRPGIDLSYLTWIGKYVADQKPDVLVCLGDFADMPSLSSYDRGKRCFEGRRYKEDIIAAKMAMCNLVEPFAADLPGEMHLTLGNHEARISRAIDDDAKLEGTLSLLDLSYEQFGWTVHDFLKPVVIDGVCYCHYLTSGPMGRPINSAAAILSKRHQTAVVGHLQGRSVAYAQRADGSHMTAIIAGSAYPHEEDYLGPQQNKHWRGIIVLHEVHDGQFDESFVSLNYLKKKYG